MQTAQICYFGKTKCYTADNRERKDMTILLLTYQNDFKLNHITWTIIEKTKYWEVSVNVCLFLPDLKWIWMRSLEVFKCSEQFAFSWDDCVLDEHSNCHRSNTSRNRSNPWSDLFHFIIINIANKSEMEIEYDSWDSNVFILTNLPPRPPTTHLWPLTGSGIALMPQSMTIAPGLTQSRFTNLGTPTAATIISAWRVQEATSFVREWHIVTVALTLRRIHDIGAPTIFDLKEQKESIFVSWAFRI